MASALKKLRKARQGSGTSLASANIGGSSGGLSSGSSGSSALAKLRAARSSQSKLGGSVVQKPTLTPEAQRYASEEEKNRGGLLGGIGYVGEKIGLGFMQGLEGVVDYVGAGIAEIFGNNEASERIISNDWMNYSHADEWFNPGEGWRIAGDVGGGIGTSLPGLAAGVAVTWATGGSGIGAGIGLALSGFSAAGTSTKEAYLESGELGGKEFGYGAIMGGVEAGVEALSGKIGAGLLKGIDEVAGAFGKTAGKTAKALTAKTLAWDMTKEFASEAFEEGFSEWISPYAKKVTYDPKAKNATIEEISYAALVGGLSGLAMGGGRVGVSQLARNVEGNAAVKEGRVSSIMDTAKAFSDYEGEHPTKLSSLEAIRDLYTRLDAQGVRTATELTGNQRRALGELQALTTTAVFEPAMQKSALSAIAGADAIAEKLNADGNVKIVDGKMQVVTSDILAELQKKGTEVRDITAEDIRGGVDVKSGKSIREALKKKDVLRYVVASDVAGRFLMTAKEVETAARAGTKIKSQADLNAFIENASEEQKHALGAELGIADNEWATLKLKRFNEAAAAYRESGKLDAKRAEMQAQKEKASAVAQTPSDVAKTLKTAKNTALTNTDQGNVSVSGGILPSARMSMDEITDNPSVAGGDTLQSLSPADAVQLPLHKGAEKSEAKAKETSAMRASELKERLDAKKIDSYAAENIEGYSSLGEANKSMIRQVVREGRASGLDDADVLTSARVAARTGLNIEYDTNTEDGVAGYYDPKANKIVVNPNAAKRQELILIHELDHALRAFRGNDGKVHYLVYKDADKRLSDDTWSAIQQEYADQDIEVSREELLADEASAYYTEAILGSKGTVDLLLGKEPSLAKKILNFFTGAARAYSKDAKLAKEARAHYRRFKKMFDAFAEWNKGRNAEPATSGDSVDKSVRRASADIAWRNVDYDDSETKAKITADLHKKMVEDGLIVKIPDETTSKVKESYPNLQGMKKKERLPILKESIKQLKNDLRAFLTQLKDNTFEFEVAGDVLEAKLYNVGIDEVLEKVTQDKAEMLYTTEEIFRNSKYLYSTPDYDGDTNIYRWNYFYTPVQIGENVVGVRIAIRDMAKQGESQIYNWGIKKDTSLGGVRDDYINRKSNDASSDVSSNPSIAHSAEKSTDSAKKVSENSSDSGKSIRKSKDITPKVAEENVRAGGESARKSTAHEAKLDEYKKPITHNDVLTLRGIGRKSINEFTSADIDAAGKWAYKFYNELHEKSPFFRAWFGDWRSEQKKDFVKIAEIPEYIGTNEARKQNRGLVKNEDTQWEIRISREGETNTISHAGDERLSEFGLSGIRGLIENSILLDSEVHEHHSNNAVNDLISFDHKMYALGEDANGNIALYKITVEEIFQSKSEPGNKRFHNLKYITKIADNVGGRTFEKSRSGGSTNDTSAKYSISDLFDFVKRYDKEFKPKSVNPALLNEDGTPKVFYHGTNAEFWEFKAEEMSHREGSYFFAENKEDAEAYGDNVYEVYLRGENLADYDNQPSEFYKLKSKREQVEWLKERGYDGWYADMDSGGWGELSVFSSEQIKSATDNIGTFDGQNKDIRFSKDITPKVAEESGTQKPLLGVFDKHGRNVKAVRSMSETKFRADILKRFRYSNADNVRERDFIDYHLGRNALEVIDMKTITEAPEVPEVSGTLKDNVQGLKLDGNAMNIDIGAVAITPVRIKDFNTRELSDTDVKLLYLTKSIIENGRVVAFSHPEGVFFEEIKIAARVKLNGKYTYAEVTVHRNDEGGTPYVYDVEASSDVKKSLSKASKPATYKRLYEKLGVGTAVTETEHLDTETGDIVLPPEIYTALKNNLRSVQISDALYKKILVKSDKITATKLKATWSYNPKYEAQRKIKAYSKGKQFTERQTVSAEEFVKEMSDLLQIPGVSANDIAGSLVKLDRIYRVNRDGGKAYRAEIENERLKERLGERFFKKLQNIAYQVKHLKEISEGTFLNSTEYNIDDFKAALAPLHRIEYRGNLVVSKVRESMKAFSKWYKPDNPMLASMDGNPDSALYSEYIGDMVKRLADGDTGLSIFELDQLDLILRHATHIVENFNRVWKNGKWVKADDTAKGFVGVADSARLLRSSADTRKISRLFDNVGRRYLTAFGDPMTLFRFMDGYQDGFFTWAGEELRAGAFRHGVDVMEMKADYDAFLEGKTHKGYVKKASKEAVEYGGAKMSKLQYISLYMTMQRQQAQRGLAENGFSLIDVNGQRVEVDGFLSRIQARIGSELGIKKSPDGAWKISDEQMKAAVESEISMMKKKLTDEDLEFIGIIERTLNGKCKELKSLRDMERLGYSNTISGYYYPIVRAMIAKTIDSQGMWGELDRASNISANKDTVKGAAGALWIESADTVFNRHIDAVARYAELSPAIDAINKIFNLDISGNKNKPRSVRTATFNSWQTSKLFGGAPSDVQRHNGEAYLKDLLADLQGIGKNAGIGETFAEGLRGGFAISALAANPKVLMTQLSSVLASTNILSMKSVSTGMRLGFGKGVGEDVDGYCPVAKLRNYDSSAAKAQGVIENVRGVGEKLMTLVSAMDRGVVRMLWGACQVEVESTKGHKIGTEENKVEAGKLLERVIQETQQNSIATEKSAAMRSKSMLMKSLTMFTSDAMKSVGRVIDAFGHLASLNARIKAAEARGDAETAKTLKGEREGVLKQARKSVGALVLTSVYMTLIARAFSWLYAKDEEEERPVLAFIADVFGGMLGGLPIISDIYDFFSNGYEISDNVYDSLNDVLTGVKKIIDTSGRAMNGEATVTDVNGSLLSGMQAICTAAGIPMRNIRNMVMGLTRRFNPNAAYRMEMLTKSKNFASDFEEAVEAGDDDKAMMILGLLLEERLGTDGERTVGDADNPSVAGGDTFLYTREALRMSKSGYNILPRTIGSTVTIAGEEVDMTPEEQSALRARYSEAVGAIEGLVGSSAYASLSDEQKESAVRFVYDSYYDQGIYELYGYERNMKRRVFSKVISADKLALANAVTAGLESDYEDERGKVVASDKWATLKRTTAKVNYSAVSGSKRKKVIAAINKLPLTTAEKLLIIAYKGYTIKDGDIRGVSAERAKRMLSSYAKKQGLTADEAKALEEYL